ncbi:MAG: tetratricopeptide repeat protein [Acidobacteriaceae bacterium]|nr:tetratricopeptide repeat protein [Acidobacteriaceae bacterium]
MRLCVSPILFCLAVVPSRSATVLVMPFHNSSHFSDLNWVGESISETLMTEFSGANEIVLSRTVRAEAMHRLSLRPDADYTKATLIRIGQTADADYLCSGSFDINLPPESTQPKDSSIRITAQFMDLRKMHDGPEISEAGKLTELARLEEHLAYESVKYLEPHANLRLEDFLSPQKTFRLDAEESYIRGLMSANKEQKQKWFLQAAALDSKFPGPAYELGRSALEEKQYAQAIDWFRRIQPTDPSYIEARFRMGLAAYGAGDYSSAALYFREVAKPYPLSEVYNDLGAAESQLNQPAAAEDFRRALESDPNNPTYLFNVGVALLKSNSYDEAAKRFQQVLAHEPNDAEGRALLDRARRREPLPPGSSAPAQRLKTSFNETAFRQLKAMLRAKRAE